MKKPLEILLIDSQTLMREGLRSIIEMNEDMRVVAAVKSEEEALMIAKEKQPELIVIDIQMIKLSEHNLLKELKQSVQKGKILILTNKEEEDDIISEVISHCDGLLLKNMTNDMLVQAIRNVTKGELIIPHIFAKSLLHNYSNVSNIKEQNEPKQESGIKFSNREKDVAQLLSEGHSNKTIAQLLFISEGTTKNYISDIYSKIGIKERGRAISFLKHYLS
ncbi:response regulator [Alkalihalobacillus sp. 1P02AB]|uniref:response regulator n=1 Tax=Alkalihalobacillus sp. 1P02AB TaxID=3132260 RepID=UPI0039A6B59A